MQVGVIGPQRRSTVGHEADSASPGISTLPLITVRFPPDAGNLTGVAGFLGIESTDASL
jgi:hypothetical protein